MPAPDLSDRYNTALSADEEQRFQAWAKEKGRARDVYDYDLRGAWKANAQEASNGHLPDTFKKPNHPTFSSESQYSGKDGQTGGRWIEGKGGRWAFEPSDTNLRNLSADELAAYFREAEPDADLRMPQQARWYPKKAKR